METHRTCHNYLKFITAEKLIISKKSGFLTFLDISKSPFALFLDFKLNKYLLKIKILRDRHQGHYLEINSNS